MPPARRPTLSRFSALTPIRMTHSEKNLETHLSILQANGVISSWHDHAIPAGKEWQDQIDERLNSAQIILLLISPDFLASKYCREVEVKRALERHKAGEARVISVMLRDVDWHGSPLSKLQVLPRDAKPVVNWPNRDQAFKDVTVGIRKVAETLHRAKVSRPHPTNADHSAPVELMDRPVPVGPRTGRHTYAFIGVIAAILLAGASYFVPHFLELKRLGEKDWANAPYDDRDFSNCMGVQACLARKRDADTLRATDWSKVKFNSALLNDCMAFPACVARKTQAERLKAVTDWKKISVDDLALLKDCMGFEACVERAQTHPQPNGHPPLKNGNGARPNDNAKPDGDNSTPLAQPQIYKNQ